MKFDPATLLTTAFLTLLLFGVVLASAVGRSRQNKAGHCWIAGFLLGALGFLLLVLLPGGNVPLSLLAANTLFVSAYGCCHAGARLLAGRRPIVWSLVCAPAAWPLVLGIFHPTFEARIVLSSLLVFGYSGAMAWEFARGAEKEERTRFIAAALCAAHAVFYLVRAIRGPTLGLVTGSTDAPVSTWGAVVALEIVLFAAALATLVVGITAERASLKERLAANTDFLTGAGSRRAFEAAMRQIVPSKGDADPAILLLIDLDHFKAVNDRLGHHAGDTLLQAFADVVRGELSDPRMFWRLGGDEFAVLLRDCRLHEAEVVKESLRRAIETSSTMLQSAGGRVVSASIGCAAVVPGEVTSDLVRRADAALYSEKSKRGRGNPMPRAEYCAPRAA